MDKEENRIEELMVEYKEKFGEYPPKLPYNMSPTSEWFETLLILSIGTNEKINPDDLEKYIEANNIPYDIIEGEE